MEEKAGSSDFDSSDGLSQLAPPIPPRSRLTTPHLPALRRLAPVAIALGALVSFSCDRPAPDTLTKIRTTGRLLYGGDKEGGGPYVYPDPSSPRDVTGFEVELMDELAREWGARPTFKQGQWDRLLQELDAGQVDLVINGYEWTEARARDFLATRPYYVYQLQLLAPRGGSIRSWDDLKHPNPKGRPWTVGALVSSAGATFASEQGGPHVQVVHFDGATDAMTAVQNGQCDATLQDVPAALFYRDRFPGLAPAGAPIGHGYYVIFVRQNDQALCDVLNRGIGRLIDSGALRRLYERYGIWTEAQSELAGWTGSALRLNGDSSPRGWRLLWQYRTLLLDAAGMTVLLSVTSMPLAMAIGLAVALGRLYGPRPVQAVLSGYVELLRGTPLMLQLYVLFYLLRLPPLVAGIGGLAINYSAYEAEIYRAGLQAIPVGQMEAALALGMSRSMALRRVIIPQAVQIVIPPVTNDFIALFKDTSVCSVITLVELTKQYSILANSTGGVFEFALATAALYMAMSIPLSWFSRWSERRLGASGAKGGALS